LKIKIREKMENLLIYEDLLAVLKDEQLKRLGVRFFIFGSYLNPSINHEKVNDIDIAISTSPETKIEALNQLRKIARTLKRKLNWEINTYTPYLPTFGYNTCTGAPLHFIIFSLIH
jgi:predicted nucleotidyltransferase